MFNEVFFYRIRNRSSFFSGVSVSLSLALLFSSRRFYLVPRRYCDDVGRAGERKRRSNFSLYALRLTSAPVVLLVRDICN